MSAVREALRYAESEFGIPRLFIHKELAAAGGRLFLDRYEELVQLSPAGQLVLREVFKNHLKAVVRDPHGVPIRLYPWMPGLFGPPNKTIFIDPRISFGTPVAGRQAISTAVLADRIDAGESIATVANDYGLQSAEVEEAIRFERAA